MNELRTKTAMKLAAPVYNLNSNMSTDPFGKDPKAVEQAIQIINETLDQATHPDHPLHGSGVLDDMRERAKYFAMSMEDIHKTWQRQWGFFN
jgi:hypothetical protein